MKIRAEIQRVARDLVNKMYCLEFSTTQGSAELYEKYKGKTLQIDIKEARKPRTDEANRYYWELLGQLAHANHVTSRAMHNMILDRYGVLDEIDGRLIEIWQATDAPYLEYAELHLRPTSEYAVKDDGTLVWMFYKIKGSRYYNTKEMSQLIDGLVSECKEVGIETLTPDQLQEIKEAWHG